LIVLVREIKSGFISSHDIFRVLVLEQM
jgi:hypothetical protein